MEELLVHAHHVLLSASLIGYADVELLGHLVQVPIDVVIELVWLAEEFVV